jgi:hypothetical protein
VGERHALKSRISEVEGRRDHLDDPVVRPGRSLLLGVERESRRRHRLIGSRLGAAAMQPRHGVKRPLERVRILEPGVDELPEGQPGEALLALDRYGGA